MTLPEVKTMSFSNINIRIATKKDAAALLDIYAPYVTDTAITFEYEIPSVEEFAGRISHTLEKYPYLVAEENGIPVGYAYAGTFHDRPAYDWAVETSIYVDRSHRKSGIGRLLYQALEQALSAQHILNLNACIAWPSAENDPYLTKDSVRFHEKLGYRLVGEFRECGYKFHRWYNMVWMEKHIGKHLEDQPDVIPFSELISSR